MRTIFLVMALASVSLLPAQKLMKLPPPLDTLTPMTVSIKSGFGFSKYEFGPYQLTEPKAQWSSSSATTDQTFLQQFLSTYRDLYYQSRQQKSFKLVSASGDTGILNMSVHSIQEFEQYKRGLLGNRYETEVFKGAQATWICSVELKDTSQHWILTAFKSEQKGILFDKVSPLKATLFNGSRNLDLVPVQHFTDGKKAPDIIGFVVQENGVPLAGVQYYGQFLKGHKSNFIWIAPQLDASMTMMLATALTGLLAIGHETTYLSLQQQGEPRR